MSDTALKLLAVAIALGVPFGLLTILFVLADLLTGVPR